MAGNSKVRQERRYYHLLRGPRAVGCGDGAGLLRRPPGGPARAASRHTASSRAALACSTASSACCARRLQVSFSLSLSLDLCTSFGESSACFLGGASARGQPEPPSPEGDGWRISAGPGGEGSTEITPTKSGVRIGCLPSPRSQTQWRS